MARSRELPRRSTWLSARLTPSEHAAFLAAARAQGVTPSEAARQAVRIYVEAAASGGDGSAAAGDRSGG